MRLFSHQNRYETMGNSCWLQGSWKDDMNWHWNSILSEINDGITAKQWKRVRDLRIPLDLASLSMPSVGSEPIDKKQTIGVLQSLSAHMTSMSSTTPSAYYTFKHEKLIRNSFKPFFIHQWPNFIKSGYLLRQNSKWLINSLTVLSQDSRIIRRSAF